MMIMIHERIVHMQFSVLYLIVARLLCVLCLTFMRTLMMITRRS